MNHLFKQALQGDVEAWRASIRSCARHNDMTGVLRLYQAVEVGRVPLTRREAVYDLAPALRGFFETPPEQQEAFVFETPPVDSRRPLLFWLVGSAFLAGDIEAGLLLLCKLGGDLGLQWREMFRTPLLGLMGWGGEPPRLNMLEEAIHHTGEQFSDVLECLLEGRIEGGSLLKAAAGFREKTGWSKALQWVRQNLHLKFLFWKGQRLGLSKLGIIHSLQGVGEKKGTQDHNLLKKLYHLLEGDGYFGVSTPLSWLPPTTPFVFPLFEIASTPHIPLTQIANRRFYE